MFKEDSIISKFNLKLLIWSLSAGVIMAFFFASTILKETTGFAPGGDILFISPIFCGFLLGLLTTRDEVYHSVMASIFATITAVVLITISLFSPILFGVAGGIAPTYYYFVIQNIMISVVLIFPVSLGTAVIGKVFGETMLMSSIYKHERSLLRKETLEWYQMLEAAAPEKEKLSPIGGVPRDDFGDETEEAPEPSAIQDEPEELPES